jgi:16S rRNA (cytosine967-C5)-methyltransferase
VLAWEPAEPFDAVLLDAPCSATGTIRRHPDVAWLKQPEDIATLSGLQARMIAKAATLLKPGGRLVYCTCSLEPEEGERQLAAATESGALVSDPIAAADLPGIAGMLAPDGTLRTLPCHAAGDGVPPGMDGFFVARFRRP